jgi:hypothetical protein
MSRRGEPATVLATLALCFVAICACKLPAPPPKAEIGAALYGGKVIAVGKEIRDVVGTAEGIAWIDRGDGIHAARADGTSPRRLEQGAQAGWLTETRGGFAFGDSAVYVSDTTTHETRTLPFTSGVGRVASHAKTDEICWVQTTYTQPPGMPKGTRAEEAEVRCSSGGSPFAVFIRTPGGIAAIAREGDDLYVGWKNGGLSRFGGRRAPPEQLELPPKSFVSAIATTPGRVAFALDRALYLIDVAKWPAVTEVCAAPWGKDPIGVKAIAVDGDEVYAIGNGTRGVVFACKAGQPARVLVDGSEEVAGIAIAPASVVYGVNRGGDAVLIGRPR